jgi:hypothetical protein
MTKDLINKRNVILERILDSYSEDIPDRYHNGFDMMTDVNAREVLDLENEKWKSLMDKLIEDGHFINNQFPSGQKEMVITEKSMFFLE